VKMLPDVLQLIAEAQLAPPQKGATIVDWPGLWAGCSRPSRFAKWWRRNTQRPGFNSLRG